MLERGEVRPLEQLLAGGGLEQVEVRRPRLVQAGDQAVDRVQAALRA